MERLHYSITIKAPVARVWDTMLEEESYKEWTEVFAPGSHYVGSWEQGSKILFLAPGEDNSQGGMVSRIKENRKHDFISIEHLGVFENGEEDTSSKKVQEWAGVLENYTFKEKDGTTELLIDMDIEEDYKEMFDEMWPKALEKLKRLAEGAAD